MSHNAVEPLERWYPVLDDRKTSRFERRSEYPQDQPIRMSRVPIQLPPPSALQLGLDPGRQSLTEPKMYGSRCRSSRTMDFPKAINREQLPPVSQLLTPSSQSSLPSSPFSPQYRLDSPSLTKSFQPSSSPSWPPDSYDRIHPLPYPESLNTPPLGPPHRKFSYPNQTSVTTRLPLRTTSYPYGASREHEHGNAAYSSYAQRSHSDPSPYQHVQPVHLGQSDESLRYDIEERRRPSNNTRSRNRSQHSDSSNAQCVPRAVREEVIPGEGPCYVYEDGSHCRKVIDGETVNASWGVTKAGKPRKRLAVACMTCREKKIKCDPNWPKCVQCDKFGRECKFQIA